MARTTTVIRFSAFLVSIFGALCQIVTVPPSPCPSVVGCTCIDYDVTRLECGNIGPHNLESIRDHYGDLTFLSIVNWDGRSKHLDLDLFKNFTSLRVLQVTGGRVAKLHSNSTLSQLKSFDLSNNWLDDFEQICSIIPNLPTLSNLVLRKNYFTVVDECIQNVVVDSLDLHHNRIRLINGTFHSNIEYLDLSSNNFNYFNNPPKFVKNLNLSSNPLKSADFPKLARLNTLDLSRTSFVELPALVAPVLKSAHLNDTSLEFADLTNWNTPMLRRLFFSPSSALMGVVGLLPSTVEDFAVSNSHVTAFSQSFFTKNTIKNFNISGNSLDCDPCVLQWASSLKDLFDEQSSCVIPTSFDNCTVGVSATQPSIIRVKHGRVAFIPCSTYGTPKPTVQWWKYRPDIYIGKFDPITYTVDRGNVSENVTAKFAIVGDGYLRIEDAIRSDVERYVCVAKNEKGMSWGIVMLRLDYSDWYSLDLFESVFWGCLAFCIVLSAFSFLLNITWILTRKSILWWIQRAERLSRVKKMVEAMEKYRVRHMESLHDKYTRRIQLVRDNYHQQVEALRISYSSQAERFRDYRTAQMESVTSHIENIRENYQQQLNRVREYGSRRAEQLWESYERQVNRVRTFSLQNRLKLMRQYKVKQRYLNKLLESFQDTHSPESLRKHEEEVRAALDLPEPDVPERHPLSRSSSFYSLPEYVLDENGQLRPSPLVPNVRFTRDAVSPPSSWRDPIPLPSTSSTHSKQEEPTAGPSHQ